MSDQTDIFAAVKTGDLQAVSDLLATNWRLARAKNQYGWTVLFEAVPAGHAEIVKVLVENGAKLSMRYGDGRTLLHQAVGCGSGIDHPEKEIYVIPTVFKTNGAGQPRSCRNHSAA